MAAIEMVCAALADLDIRRNVPMHTITTFGLGGPADAMLFASSEQDVLRAMLAANAYEAPLYVMGNGSNILVRDGGIRGLVVVIGRQMSGIRMDGTTVHAEAGASLTTLSKEAIAHGLQGLEWACGIPGTLGGACAMNAGAYEGCIQQALRYIRYLEDGKLYTKRVEPEEMGYRKSAYASPKRIVLSAQLQLEADDGGAAERQATFIARRKEKQPLSERSAGSTFKRPPGQFAGALIEGAGLKGARIGGAVVSPLHAGFVVNDGSATADDVLRLIAHIQQRVHAAYGVQLSCEMQIWGEDALS